MEEDHKYTTIYAHQGLLINYPMGLHQLQTGYMDKILQVIPGVIRMFTLMIF